MEENLVGYLLKALDDDTQQQVEASLQTSPQLRTRLELLERALAPLAADVAPPELRPGLVLSTLALVAAHQCRKLPSAPPPSRHQVTMTGRHWLRRPDVLVAALLLIVLGGLGASALVHVWRDNNRAACQNNLALMYRTGFHPYCLAHDGNFPRVEETGVRSVAGIFVPILCENGMLSPEVSMMCPAQGHRAPKYHSVHELEELYDKQPDQFFSEARQLAGDYAYTLGYHDDLGHHGLRCDSGDTLPIMADRLESLDQPNSANHSGKGQNVLYLGGNVQWHTNRNAGIEGDDIFSNWDHKVLAGKSREDTVLGPSDASPTPRE